MLLNLKIIIVLNLFLLLFTSGFLIQFLKIEINIDNQLAYDKEDNIDFSEYSTTVKPISIYKQNTISQDISTEQFNNYNIVMERLKNHINLAKFHGIYGFAFHYPFFDKNIPYSPIDIII